MLNVWKKGTAALIVLVCAILLSGCMLGGEQAQKQMNLEDPPQDITYIEEEELQQQLELDKENEDIDSDTISFTQRELYLIDRDGYVVPQTLALPHTKEVAKQALEYLVKDGPVSDILPNGFQAVLPPDTQILGVNLLEDGTVVVDFSNEFANYSAEEEEKILQSITWTLTQFDNIEKVQIRINGVEQPFMPVNGTPIDKGVSRLNGINVDTSDVVDITNSKPMTLYFLNQNGDYKYYVPVTKRFHKNENLDELTAVVNALIKGPALDSPLLSAFHPDMALLDEPKYNDGTVTLNFNEAILGNLEGTAISMDLLQPLVLSLTEQEGIEAVSILVNGEAGSYTSQGDILSEPVMRPQIVNTGSF